MLKLLLIFLAIALLAAAALGLLGDVVIAAPIALGLLAVGLIMTLFVVGTVLFGLNGRTPMD